MIGGRVSLRRRATFVRFRPPPQLAAALLFALNPNMLYLQSIAHDRSHVRGGARGAAVGDGLVPLIRNPVWAVLAAAAASNAASLTRYEGWFLIPFVALYFLVTARRKSYALVFAVLAALGPLAWLAHNQYYYSNALEFYSGECSAQSHLRRANWLRAGPAIPAITTGARRSNITLPRSG